MKTSEVKQVIGKANGQRALFIKIADCDKALGNIVYVLGFEQTGEHYYKILPEGDKNGVVTMAKTWIKGRIYDETEQRIICTALEAEFGLLASPQAQMQWINNLDDVDIISRCMNIL